MLQGVMIRIGIYYIFIIVGLELTVIKNEKACIDNAGCPVAFYGHGIRSK